VVLFRDAIESSLSERGSLFWLLESVYHPSSFRRQRVSAMRSFHSRTVPVVERLNSSPSVWGTLTSFSSPPGGSIIVRLLLLFITYSLCVEFIKGQKTFYSPLRRGTSFPAVPQRKISLSHTFLSCVGPPVAPLNPSCAVVFSSFSFRTCSLFHQPAFRHLDSSSLVGPLPPLRYFILS